MKTFSKQGLKSNPQQEELAKRIANRIISSQTQVATFLNRRMKHLSGNAKRILLILFCALFAIINLYLIIKSI